MEQDMSHGLRNLAPMSWCTLTRGHSSSMIPHRARKEPWFSGPYTKVGQDMSRGLRNLAPMSWCTLTRGHSSSMIPHRAWKEPWFSGPYTEVGQDMSHGLQNLVFLTILFSCDA
ncbi:hypothetical protein NDU88_000138 [Pleurodeles waltl]|uniref:Uncharacterized protein n=1 Tax=Pleurodeles waltl TaxID=8319 RepID=A0AAV7LC24_PLEWA|nr:hypothetical protein NDU88_000138 [Pleurodeles waltl]